MVDVYSEVANFGIIFADVRLIITVVISIILIIIGIIIIVKPTKRNKTVTAIITSLNCVEHAIDGSVKKDYECTFSVKYTINDKENTSELTQINSVPYKINQKIELYYDPNDIKNIDTFSDDYRIFGWIIIVVSIFLVLFSAIWVFIVRKSKFAAAIGGGTEGLGLIKSLFI